MSCSTAHLLTVGTSRPLVARAQESYTPRFTPPWAQKHRRGAEKSTGAGNPLGNALRETPRSRAIAPGYRSGLSRTEDRGDSLGSFAVPQLDRWGRGRARRGHRTIRVSE